MITKNRHPLDKSNQEVVGEFFGTAKMAAPMPVLLPERTFEGSQGGPIVEVRKPNRVKGVAKAVAALGVAGAVLAGSAAWANFTDRKRAETTEQPAEGSDPQDMSPVELKSGENATVVAERMGDMYGLDAGQRLEWAKDIHELNQDQNGNLQPGPIDIPQPQATGLDNK